MKSFAVFLPVAVLLGSLVNEGFACFSTFKNAQNITLFQEDCAKSAGLSSVPSAEDLDSDDFNDKCYSKCVLIGLQLIDNEGRVDKDLLLDFMEVNGPEAYLLKLSELGGSCSETTGIDKISGGTKMGKTPQECAPIQQFYACLVAGGEKLC